MINNIDITIVMRSFLVSRFSLHQDADGALTARTSGEPFSQDALATALRQMFGADQRISFETLPAGGEKVIPYTSELDLAL